MKHEAKQVISEAIENKDEDLIKIFNEDVVSNRKLNRKTVREVIGGKGGQNHRIEPNIC